MRPGCVLIGVLLVLTVVPAATAKRFVGNARDNRIVGTQARDTIFGRRGDDVLSGRAGRDRIDGEEGNDVVLGGGGRDTLLGRGLDDTLDGGPRIDTIYAGYGSDVISGGGGNDLIYADERDERLDSIDCGPGNDRVILRRGDRAFNCETIVRRRGPRLSGTYSSFTAGADVRTVEHGNGSSRELWAGLGGADTLSTLAGNDVLWGNSGHDTLEGGHGRDWLLGGRGNDGLYGGTGRDRLWGGMGTDRLNGNAIFEDSPNTFDDEMPDLLFAVEDDGRVDIVVCGRGDRAVVRRNDRVRNGSLCARIIRIPRG